MATIVGLCTVTAGCGTAKLADTAPAAAKPAASGPTAAGNRAAARVEAARLISLALVPSGSVRLARPPRALSGPALGTPGVSSLVDQLKAWRVRMPFETVQAWLLAHPPRGLRTEADTTSQDNHAGQIIMIGNGYSAPASRAWQSAGLEIGAAASGPHATVIRADAVVVWLDPRPVRSGPGKHPARVTLASGCPREDRGVTGVTNPGSKLTRRLLPPGQPVAGLRCRYDGLNGHLWDLVATTHLTAQAARETAKSMSAMRLSHPDGEVLFCPSDDDSSSILVLAYPGHVDVDLWIHLTGCGGVSNGYISVGNP